MSDGTDRVTLHAPSGATYDVDVAWAEVAGETRLHAVLAAADLPALDADELFHLVPAARPGELGLEPGLDTVLELRPDVPVDDPGASAAAWLLAHPDRLATDRWFVAALGQPEADPPVVAATLWGYTDAVGPDADPAAVLAAGERFLSEQHPDLFAGLAEMGGLGPLFGSLLGTPPESDPLPAFEALLTEAGATFERLDGGAALAFPAEGAWGSWICLAEVSPATGSLLLYGLLPMEPPPDRLAEAWELVGRFNSRRPTGTIQIDPESGRTVVRTSLILDAAPSRTVLRRLLQLNIEAMDEALPVVERFVAGASVEAALTDPC